MWPRQSHTLSPLTILTSIKKKFKCTQVKQDAFGEIISIVTGNNLSNYTDLNETLKFTPILARSN